MKRKTHAPKEPVKAFQHDDADTLCGRPNHRQPGLVGRLVDCKFCLKILSRLPQEKP